MTLGQFDQVFSDRFFGSRVTSWQELGSSLKDTTAREAMIELGMDHQFVDAAIGYTLPDGTFIEDPKRKAILREPTQADPNWATMGVVSTDYSYLQNLEIADGVDLIAKQTGWALTSVGSLNNGGSVYATLDAGSRSVFGDPYQQVFLVSDGKASGRSLKVSVIPYRLICTNGLMAVDSSSLVSVKIRHDLGIQGQFDFWLELISHLTKARESSFEALETMASIKIRDDQAKAIIASAYPMPKPSLKGQMIDTINAEALADETKAPLLEMLTKGDYWSQWQREGISQNREAAFNLYQRFNEGAEQGGHVGRGGLTTRALRKVRKTPYAALQAVTELADWGGKERSDAQGRIAKDSLFGDRAKTKSLAWNAALQMAVNPN